MELLRYMQNDTSAYNKGGTASSSPFTEVRGVFVSWESVSVK